MEYKKLIKELGFAHVCAKIEMLDGADERRLKLILTYIRALLGLK